MTGLVPIVAIHSTYLVSALQGHVPWCFPYFESCTSISATGRHGAAYFLFKGTMIPAAMLLMAFWFLVDAGFGLRLASSKSDAGRFLHIDIAFPLTNRNDPDVDSSHISVRLEDRF